MKVPQEQQHINLLGMGVEDRITGAKGVITSITFTLSGSVQGYVTHKNANLKGRWYEVVRFKLGKRAIGAPKHLSSYIVDTRKNKDLPTINQPQG